MFNPPPPQSLVKSKIEYLVAAYYHECFSKKESSAGVYYK